jgi:DNA-binding transcriptional MerR regulator/uncharacterized protein (DUF433 family)
VEERLLGIGIYTIPEAVRLTGVSAASIRRWLWGYRHKTSGGPMTRHEPLWTSQIPTIEDSRALGFRDLIEIKFVDHFRRHGISLQSIRKTIDRATELLEQSYPLSAVRFKSLGKSIFAEVLEENERKLVFDLYTGQLLLSFMWDRLYDALEYSEFDELIRWFPLGKNRRVVVDPRRSFGRPISLEGVPTAILASALRAEKSVESVAYWYKVAPDSVRDADDYERASRAA